MIRVLNVLAFPFALALFLVMGVAVAFIAFMTAIYGWVEDYFDPVVLKPDCDRRKLCDALGIKDDPLLKND